MYMVRRLAQMYFTDYKCLAMFTFSVFAQCVSRLLHITGRDVYNLVVCVCSGVFSLVFAGCRLSFVHQAGCKYITVHVILAC